MTQDDIDPSTETGGMAEHLERYKSYISNLKQGKSSGISAAFGRAKDLLPAEFFSDRNDFIGTEIRMPDGRTTVAEVRVQDGDRLFVLKNGHVIDERAFAVLAVQKVQVPTKTEPKAENVEAVADAAVAPANAAGTPADAAGALVEEHSEPLDEEEVAALEALVRSLELEINIGNYGETDLHFDDSDSTEDWSALQISTAYGANLWTVTYDQDGIYSIVMEDGSAIRRAEGRDNFVLALMSDDSTSVKFFILDGLIVDPSTGNIYCEANEGAYFAAFLNNGWIVHQYRTAEGDETHFASEPFEPEVGRVTTQVVNLELDPAKGEVTFDALDGSASTILKSRQLY